MEKKIFTIPAQSMSPKEFCSPIREAVTKYLAAKTFATYHRREVDKRGNALLAQKVYLDEEGNRITEKKYNWMIADETQSAEYYRLLDKANREAGWDGPEGYCPALVARKAELTATKELIEAAEPNTTISYEMLNRMPGSTEKLAEYVDLLVAACLACPE